MIVTGNDIVTQARTWLGTGFVHQGRSKKNATQPGGVDCIGLVVGVSGELRIYDKDGKKPLNLYDRADYSRQPSGDRLVTVLDQHLMRVYNNEIAPGDILLFSIIQDPQHVGIVSDYFAGGLGLIHCFQGTDKVVEHFLSDQWRKRIVQAYRFYPESLIRND